MKSMMKRTLSYILSLSVITTSTKSLAANPVASAAQMVEQAQLAAEADAGSLVVQEFDRILNLVNTELENHANKEGLLDEYSQLIAEVNSEFQDLANISIEELREEGVTSADLETFMQQYEAAIRKLFKAQWAPAAQRQSFERAVGSIKLYADEFQKTCSAGKVDFEKSYTGKGFDMPKYMSYFQGKVNIGDGGIEGIDINYGVETAGSEQAAKDRRMAIDISLKAAEITGTAWLGKVTGTATVVSGTKAGAMLVAAAPYAAAVAVVVMAITSIAAQDEAFKIAKEINKANLLLANASPDHNDLAKYFQESCGQYSALFKKVSEVFANIPTDGGTNQALENARKLKPAIEKWKGDSSTFAENTCKVNLDLVNTEFGCYEYDESKSEEENLEALKELVEAGDYRASCSTYRSKNEISSNLQGKTCSLPIDTEDRKPIIEKAIAYNDSYNTDYPTSKVAELVPAATLLALQNQYEIQKEFEIRARERSDEFRKAAFDKMMAYIELVQELRPLTEGEQMLKKEFAASERFFDLRDELMNLGIEVVHGIFNDADFRPIAEKFDAFEKELSPFWLSYLHIDEVDDLMTSFQRIHTQVKGQL